MRNAITWCTMMGLACLGGCGGSYAGSQTPTPVNGLAAEDRVLFGDFSRVTAMAAAPDRIYVAYAYGVTTWHPAQRRWDIPSAPADPRVLAAVTAAVVDPLDRSLWLAAGNTWLRYDPSINRWSSGPLPVRALGLATDLDHPAGGAWYRTATGWFNVGQAGIVAVPSGPPRRPDPGTSVEAAMRDLPALRALAPQVATGPLQQQGTLTAAAPDPGGAGWFIGTSNRGLVFFDRMATEPTPIPFGLPGLAVGALIATGDTVWVATDADPAHPAAITALLPDGSVVASVTGSASRGVSFASSRALLYRGDSVWAATDQGVVTSSTAPGLAQATRVATGTSGSRAFALAMHRGVLFAGTDRGLLTMGDDGIFRRADPQFGELVLALASYGDTLWVGTARGLFALVDGTGALRMPEGFARLTADHVPVFGIGYAGDTLIAMTADRLLWRDPGSGSWSEGPLLSSQLGPLRTFAASSGGAWVGGARGAAFVRPTTTTLRLLTVPDALPDEVTAIVTTPTYLWVATRAGLVRWRLSN